MADRIFHAANRGPSAPARYGVAIVSILGCASAWAVAAPRVEFEATLLLFVLPLLLSTWYGGRGPGIVAAVLAVASSMYLMPYETSASGVRGDYLDLLLFATEAIVIVALIDALRRARDEADAANRSKEMFFAIVSHELRTPLTVISGWLAQLAERPADLMLTRRALDRIAAAARMQARLIEDLLDLSRAMSGKLALQREPTPLSPVLASAIDDARVPADVKHVEIRADIDTTAIVAADAIRLTQVFANLLNNAIKFTPEGGRIEVSAAVAGDLVRVVVNDNGPGIPSGMLPHIFEPFRQVDAARDAKAGGLGLGLAVAKHVVELHGGRIAAENRDRPPGTTFIVDLLVAGDSASALQNRCRAALAGPPRAAESPALQSATRERISFRG